MQVPETEGVDIILSFHGLARAEEVVVFIVNFCTSGQQTESAGIGFPVELENSAPVIESVSEYETESPVIEGVDSASNFLR